jgi:hypothetical protein
MTEPGVTAGEKRGAMRRRDGTETTKADISEPDLELTNIGWRICWRRFSASSTRIGAAV